MHLISIRKAMIAAAVVTLAPAAAVGQEVADKANEVAEQAQEMEQQAEDLSNQTDGQYAVRDEERDDGFDWGLLGLLGLAGLLGLRKKDDHHDIHVDTRNNNRT